MSTAFPAATWLPAEFDNETPDWAFSLRDLKPDTPQKFYITSQIQKVWRYFDQKNRPKLSMEFPDNYETDIGNAYKSDTEKAKPTTIWFVRAWHVEAKRMVCLTIDSFPVMKRLSKELRNNEQLLILGETPGSPLGVSNFYIELTKDSTPITPALTYLVDIHLRPTQSETLRAEAMLPWYPENYVHLINPLQPAPAMPAQTGIAQPAPSGNGTSTHAQPSTQAVLAAADAALAAAAPAPVAPAPAPTEEPW